MGCQHNDWLAWLAVALHLTHCMQLNWLQVVALFDAVASRDNDEVDLEEVRLILLD